VIDRACSASSWRLRAFSVVAGGVLPLSAVVLIRLAASRAVLRLQGESAATNFPPSRYTAAATREEHGTSRKGAKRTTTSRFRGVTRFRGRWVAQISFQNTYRFLGSFAEEAHAAQAYDRCSDPVYPNHIGSMCPILSAR
jgi:hypothetical protein